MMTHSNTDLHARIAELEAKLVRWGTHQSFGVPRRMVLEDRWPDIDYRAYWLIALDLDELKACNTRYTQAGVDSRICATFNALRSQVRSGDCIYQWDGGDFFVWLLPRTDEMEGLRWHVDPKAAAERLQSLLLLNGLSASYAIVSPDSDLEASVTRGELLFKQARGGERGEGIRGIVVMEAI
jgi:GGDEF domain-containing protein